METPSSSILTMITAMINHCRVLHMSPYEYQSQLTSDLSAWTTQANIVRVNDALHKLEVWHRYPNRARWKVTRDMRKMSKTTASEVGNRSW